MKHLNLLAWIIGATILFSGCAKEDFSPPGLDPVDQETTSLKAAKKALSFSGVCSFVADGDEGNLMELPNGKSLLEGMTTIWHDDANDPLVTGQTTWYVKQKIEADGTFKYWGKAELLCDDGLGKWQMTWRGHLNEDGLIATAVGQGKEGAVKGMVAEWTYTMDFGLFVYNFTGSYH
ncbi:MAG: hypothetical protein ABFS38_12645 [Bacteroidota bacterium]